MKQQQLKVLPSTVSGKLAIPPSKSQTLRAILLASMACGESTIEQVLDSPDAKAMVEACRSLGAQINQLEDVLTITGIEGKVVGAHGIIDAGNSGLVLRFISAIAALGTQPVVITGDSSIQSNRPMEDLLTGLQRLGVEAVSKRGNGYAPVSIKGPLVPGSTFLHGNDSQPVSALLMAAALSDGEYEIIVEDPGEKPWVSLTLGWLDRIGVIYSNDQFSRYTVKGRGKIDSFRYTVPGDLSSCAFPVAAALVTRSTLTIENVDLEDLQGDKQLFNVLKAMGAKIEEDSRRRQLQVTPSSLYGIDIDINNFIDAIVILAVIACFADGETIIRNGAIARHKECDRIAAVTMELKKMGADIEEREDGLVIRQSSLHGAHVSSHCDHRMAMALSAAAMGADGETIIDDIACIAKTYPSFVRDFVDIGARMEKI